MDKRWWDVEIARYVDGGIDPKRARTATILQWMLQGDLMPLAHAIVAGHEIPGGVLYLLADMILGDCYPKPPPYQIKVVSHRRGRPRNPGNPTRDLWAALAYEKEGGKSDEAFDRVGKAIGTSPRTVRQAVTARRKARRDK
jgi:hypothetical protein